MSTAKSMQQSKRKEAECEELKGQLKQKLEARRKQQVFFYTNKNCSMMVFLAWKDLCFCLSLVVGWFICRRITHRVIVMDQISGNFWKG